MSNDPGSSGASTLLTRIRDVGDQEAWEEFVERYAPSIYAWCVQGNFERSAAEAMTQGVVTRFYLNLRKLPAEAPGDLRVRLRDSVREAVLGFLAEWGQTTDAQTYATPHGAGGRFPCTEALLERLEERFAGEILAEAQARVRRRVDSETWDIYDQLEAGGKASEIAASLGKSLEAVHCAHAGVASTICEEAELLGWSVAPGVA